LIFEMHRGNPVWYNGEFTVYVFFHHSMPDCYRIGAFRASSFQNPAAEYLLFISFGPVEFEVFPSAAARLL
jgi:hypothetical protein